VRYPSILDELGMDAPACIEAAGGGCIANAAIATFNDGSRVFVKWVADSGVAAAPDMFRREAEGLRELAKAGAIRVPEVLAVGKHALALEMIESGPRKKDFAADFGRRLAALHTRRGKTCGFTHDNFIGASVQYNAPMDGPWDAVAPDGGASWPEFFFERRLRVQVTLAACRGHGAELERLLDRAQPRIMELLGATTELPSLLHGDLWGGNYIVDGRGEACLIDPAVYYGNREADLAMTRLFGGFEPSFYAAYNEVLPLADGHEQRLAIYQLYHVLNHLNLFGAAYLEQSWRLLRLYAA